MGTGEDSLWLFCMRVTRKLAFWEILSVSGGIFGI